MTRWSTLALYAVAAALAVGIAADTATIPWDRYLAGMPDAGADKYLTRAAWGGYGADRTMNELAGHYWDGSALDQKVTRTPGALLVQAPLMFVPDGWLLVVFALASTAGLVVVVELTGRRHGWPFWAAPLLALVAVAALHMAFMLGTTAIVTAALLTWGWYGRRFAGLALGLAAVLKVWPLLVIGAIFLTGRRRVSVAAAVWFVSLNALGLLLPGAGVPVAGDWTGHQWNLSLVPVVGLTAAAAIGAVVLALAWQAYRDDRFVASAVVVGLLVSPLSWPWYWVAAIPAAAALVVRRGVEVRGPVETEEVKRPEQREGRGALAGH